MTTAQPVQDESKTQQPSQAARKTARPKRSKPKGKPFVAYDAGVLTQKASEGFWNQVHDLKIARLEGDVVIFALPEEQDFSEITVPAVEFGAVAPEIGSEWPIYVADPIPSPKPVAGESDAEPSKSILTGSHLQAQEFRMLTRVNQAYKRRKPIEGFVMAPVKGGFCVALMAKNRAEAEAGIGLRAFLPTGYSGLGRDGKIDLYTDEAIDFRVRDFAPKNTNIILSRKEILFEARKEALEARWPELSLGDVVNGAVKSVVEYGAFIDVGGVDGFVHISDIAWESHKQIKKMIHVGDPVSAKIIKLDNENKKVKLSIKATLPDPWQAIKDKFPIGSSVKGIVVAMADFGVFVRLEDGIEGLVHTSELSWGRAKHPSKLFHIGDEVTAMVLDVDEKSRRIALSLKALEKSPVERVSEKYDVGARVKTKISGVAEFGLFVELDEDVQGLVHIGEISWTDRVEDLATQFKEGDETEVLVTGFDEVRQRISCSIKRLEDNPWDEWRKKYAVGKKLHLPVARVTSGGAEFDLDGGLVAFCPTNHLSENRVGRAQDAVKVADVLDVQVIECSQRDFKVVVSAKALAQAETKDAYRSYLKDQEKNSAGKVTLGDMLNKSGSRPTAGL